MLKLRTVEHKPALKLFIRLSNSKLHQDFQTCSQVDDHLYHRPHSIGWHCLVMSLQESFEPQKGLECITLTVFTGRNIREAQTLDPQRASLFCRKVIGQWRSHGYSFPATYMELLREDRSFLGNCAPHFLHCEGPSSPQARSGSPQSSSMLREVWLTTWIYHWGKAMEGGWPWN